MANAAIPFDREAYDAAGLARPMGRNSAGEGFLRGFLHHAVIERLYLWNVGARPAAELDPLLQRLGPPRTQVSWIDAADRAGLAAAGAAHFPAPVLQGEAWARRAVGGTAYSLTGVTHTIAESYIMSEVAGLLVAPIEPWDALVCTSNAVRTAVRTQLEAVAAHLAERLGAVRIPPAQLVTIPLGVHAEDFAFDPGARARWRVALDIPQDAPTALYFGRFSVETKMHPGPMGLALQEASRRLGRPVYWVLFGGARAKAPDDQFRAAAKALCPDVIVRFVGEAAADAHGPVWSAADVFLSLSDNIQESFGLTVTEAMAAGLPSVVSDWDGYRDTLRHGIDGFRVRTITPRPGLGADLAYRHAHGLSSYASYAGATAQFTAVDVEAAAEALSTLFADPQLRRRMGLAAQARARDVFDWRVIIPQYQALWAELARRRAAAPPQPPRSGGDNPWGMDPFAMFAAYPTQRLSHTDEVLLPRALTRGQVARRLSAADVRLGQAFLPTIPEAQALIAALSPDRGVAVAVLLDGFPPERRPFLERGLVWLAKYGLLRLSGEQRF
jgi:glycosyltransferase involved in cell wall biosynthesis